MKRGPAVAATGMIVLSPPKASPSRCGQGVCDLERLGFRPGMRLVVAGTAPLNYLVLIDAIELLPKLFAKVFTPEAVRATS